MSEMSEPGRFVVIPGEFAVAFAIT